MRTTTFDRRHATVRLFLLSAAMILIFTGLARADIMRFVGEYVGSAEVVNADGTTHQRDMSVVISKTKKGFSVKWSSTTKRANGDDKTKVYTVQFVKSPRQNVFAAAMETNIFGHEVPLNPMQGEPYVWARLEGDTLSVYSLFVTDEGAYELQQYDRTRVENGLMLDFQAVSDGAITRRVETFLTER